MGDRQLLEHVIEEARVRALWRSGAPDDAPTAVLDDGSETGVQSVVARIETEFLAVMPYLRAPIDVEVWLGRLGGASMELCFELYSPTHVEPRVLFVRSTTTLVTISAETGSPVRIPEQVRAAWADYIEEPIRFTRR